MCRLQQQWCVMSGTGIGDSRVRIFWEANYTLRDRIWSRFHAQHGSIIRNSIKRKIGHYDCTICS